jgi:DNA (cytosine-5)-methyltransferase 1
MPTNSPGTSETSTRPSVAIEPGPSASTSSWRAEVRRSSEPERWAQFLATGSRGLVPGPLSLRAADLFCGVGGLFLGAREAARELGMELASGLAIDRDEGALTVYKHNHLTEVTSSRPVELLTDMSVRGIGDSAAFVGEPVVVDQAVGALTGELDLLLAGPPCQGHSNLNNRTRGNDPRNRLYLYVPAIACALDIPVVIIENVPGVMRSHGQLVETARGLLEDDGFSTTTGVLRADAMGWPQTRARFFLVATKGWQPLPLEEVQQALERPPRAVSWLLSDVPLPIGSGVMDIPATLSDENRRRIDYLFDADVDDLPLDRRPECHQGGTTHTASYGRMRWDRPAPTLTTGFSTPGRGRFVHPRERRTLTLREGARVQGLPDTMAFQSSGPRGGRNAIARWIGNAVPAPLAHAAVLAALIPSPWAGKVGRRESHTAATAVAK